MIDCIYFKDCIDKDAFKNSGNLEVCLGKDNNDNVLMIDIKDMKNTIISGMTGTGTTTLIYDIILSLLLKNKNNEVKNIIINTIPYDLYQLVDLRNNIKLESKDYYDNLIQIENIMNDRLRIIDESNSKTIDEYNLKTDNKMEYIVVAGFDYYNFLYKNRKEKVDLLNKIFKKCNDAGIYFIMSTNRLGKIEEREIDFFDTKIAFKASTLDKHYLVDKQEELDRKEFILLNNKIKIKGIYAFPYGKEMDNLIEDEKDEEVKEKELLTKKTYLNALNEITTNFKNIIDKKIPFSYIKTDYNGWTKLLHRIEKEDCKTINYGVRSYMVNATIKAENDNITEINVCLNDDIDDKKYTDKYYRIDIINDNKRKIELNVSNENYKNHFDYKIDAKTWDISVDFAYYNNSFVIITREDYCPIYSVFLFHNDCNKLLKEFVKDLDLEVESTNIINDIVDFYNDFRFKYNDNQELLNKICDKIVDALTKKDLSLLDEYIGERIRYSSNYIYGDETHKNLELAFKEILESKEIIRFDRSIFNNDFLLGIKIKTKEDKLKNIVLQFTINSKIKIKDLYRVEPALFDVDEYPES